MGCSNSKPIATSAEEKRPILQSEREREKQQQQQNLPHQMGSIMGGVLEADEQNNISSTTGSNRSAANDAKAYDKLMMNSVSSSGRTGGGGSERTNASSMNKAYDSVLSTGAVAPPHPVESMTRQGMMSSQNVSSSDASAAKAKGGGGGNKLSSGSNHSTCDRSAEMSILSSTSALAVSSSLPPLPPSATSSSTAAPPSPIKEVADTTISHTVDPYWETLYKSLSPHLLDPEDLPSTLDATISNMINHLSPAEVSFIKRRAKASIRCTIGSNDGGGSSDTKSSNSVSTAIAGYVSSAGSEGGGSYKRSSLSKKMGRLVGKSSDKGGGGGSSASVGGNNADGSSSHNGLMHLQQQMMHPALDESSDRIKSSKSVFQKERLMDITIIRKVFEGGECSLKALRSSVKAELLSDAAVIGAGSTTTTAAASSSQHPSSSSSSHLVEQHQDGMNKSAQQLDAEAIEKIDIYASAFLLCIYMSESRWDYITEIAKLSAREAGITLDVNKLALQEAKRQQEEEDKSKKSKKPPKKQNSSSEANTELPLPPRPPSFTPPNEFYNQSDLAINEPGGIHLTTLCFLISMALRGTRRQKLTLLFHLLLPPKELNAILASHPAGGLPTWLLEVDTDVVLSYDSLSYYYNYEGVVLPSSNASNNKQSEHVGSSNHGRRRLCIDAKSSVEILATLLADSLDNGNAKGDGSNSTTSYGTQRLASVLSPTTNNNTKDSSEKLDSSSLSSIKCQGFREMLLHESQHGVASSELSSSLFAHPRSLPSKEIDQIGKFAELSSALTDNASMSNGEAVRLAWSMNDFVEWANVAIADGLLFNIMRQLFGTGILPSAKMECELVAQRWIDWNLHQQHLEYGDDTINPPTASELDDVGSSSQQPTSTTPAVRSGLRKIFTSHDSGHPSDEFDVGDTSSSRFGNVWGGIGGTDGKGGLGNGVLYCIDKQWWDDWVAFTGWTTDKEDSGHKRNNCPSSMKRPRELSTERLIDRSNDAAYVSGSRGSYELMQHNLVLGEDYVLVPPGVWNVLYEMYAGGPPLPRMVCSNNGSNDSTHMNGGAAKGVVSLENEESVEVIRPASPVSSSGIHWQHYPQEIPTSVRVVTHPWIFHCQICDPQQPYRRGDAGPLSIRIMATPDQPLWRLFAEIVIRLPISHAKTRDNQTEGRARLWRFEVPNGKVPNPASSFGPWVLLCKNRYAEIPVNTSAYEKFEGKWEAYSDQHSVESIGLSDGMRLMLEYAVANKDGKYSWPREAAAKATAKRRIADEDAIFRLFLRGLDGDGEPLNGSIMRNAVDAMDASGRWYQAIIVNVDNSQKSNSDSSGASEPTSNDRHAESPSFRENTHIRVHFKDHTDNHHEWIDVKSDRLAVKGRMTSTSMRHLDNEHDRDDAEKPSETKPSRIITSGLNKKKDTTDTNTPDPNSAAVCLFPGYGACGLMNLGNTCYANSGWQCMSYLPLLRSYLLSGQWKIQGDLNRDNPLGTGGKIMEEFSELLRFMWSGKYGARAPQKFRSFLAKCRSQYSGADQQDAQELLNDMFDMLHEDGNRVKKKPYVEALEDKFIEKTELSRVGQEAWRRFLRRNRSAVSDLSMGQVYNRVTCPVCNHSSKNFDPFNMLSLPFPTVAEVIFQCTVVRRATGLNCPSTLASVGKRRQESKDKSRTSTTSQSPPSKELILEEYLIPMSRLADIGDLKLKLQNMSGIPAKDLRICKKEEIETDASESSKMSYTRIYTKVSALPDKEGPCVKLLQQASLDDLSSPTIAQIVAFETTLVTRPIELPSTTHRRSLAIRGEIEDDASTTADEMSDDSSNHAALPAYQSKAEESIIQEYLKVYGDENECVVYDTNPTPLAKVISRSLWPRSTKDFTLGLRVDAIDHRNHWFPGSVIEIVDGHSDSTNPEDNSEPTTKVKIHFDNFSAKWDEMYSIDQFTQGRVCPLYSHATPRPKPTEFIVHHRGFDRKAKKAYLFGQSFYIQCHNEWSTARAGAHILAQASRFLEVSHFKQPENGKKLGAIDQKIAEKERHEVRKVISRVIEALIKSDRKYVESAIEDGRSTREDDDQTPFDVSTMSIILSKKLGEVLPLLPFDVRVTTANAPLGTNENDDAPFPFSLVRTIGNYMNARHSLVLHWRERPDNVQNSKSSSKKHSGGTKHFLYSPPLLASHKQSRGLLNKGTNNSAGGNALKRHPSTSHGGLHIGVCLTEFCKEQQLDATGCWRCPVCKLEREGKQSMALWNLPDLLTFHLKRFNASSRWREKISTKVDFPLTGLNMREWCDAESPLCQESDDESFVYDLVGVVNHYGGMTGGHYVAMCKATACSPDGDEDVSYNFNGAGVTDLDSAEEETVSSSRSWTLGGRSKEKDSSPNAAAKAVAESAEPLWLQFDDDLVEPLPPRNVVSEASYVLFYRRRRMHPANIAKYSSL